MKTLLIFFTAVSLNLTFLSRTAAACSCPEKMELEAALTAASLVFVGQVKEKTVNPLKDREYQVKFTASRKLKGFEEVPTNQVIIYTPSDPEFCGAKFTPGMDYLVFATGTPAHFQTDVCSRTDMLEKVMVDVHKLIRITGGRE